VSLAPRAVIVTRRTELEELLARHGTPQAAEFFLRARRRTLEQVESRHAAQVAAVATVATAIPVEWRRGQVDRSDLDRFLFSPEDIVVVVGQDGLVANVAKYLDGQPVIGVDPEPGRNPGVLVPHHPGEVGALLTATADGSALVERRTMVEAHSDDGQSLVALNEIYLGQPSHQSARYLLELADGSDEHQSSSGVLVGTGTGATGWCRSCCEERHSAIKLPSPTDESLCWFVREPWPSPVTGTSRSEGILEVDEQLKVTVESDRLVVFGDGIEADALTVAWGQQVSIGRSSRTLRAIAPPQSQ